MFFASPEKFVKWSYWLFALRWRNEPENLSSGVCDLVDSNLTAQPQELRYRLEISDIETRTVESCYLFIQVFPQDFGTLMENTALDSWFYSRTHWAGTQWVSRTHWAGTQWVPRTHWAGTQWVLGLTELGPSESLGLTELGPSES